MNKLYHFQVYMPDLPLNFGKQRLNYSNHALNASRDDRYGDIQLPTFIDTNTAKIIEVEIQNDRYLTKVVYRVPYSETHDLIVVAIPERWFVKTVWLNAKSDKHQTLNKNRYEQKSA
jgi:hypothetical protein